MFKGTFDALAKVATLTVAVSAFAQPLAAADDLASVAARVQVLEDREAIPAVILAYAQAHDHLELMNKTIGHNPQPNGSGTYHVMTNDQIKIDGDRASATTKWLYITHGDDNAPKLVFLGHYDDQFVRENGEWKFLRREAPADIPSSPR